MMCGGRSTGVEVMATGGPAPESEADDSVVRFGEYTLDAMRFELRRGDDPIHVEPRVFDVLVHLVAHRDRVVSKHELLDDVWGDRFVGESALTSRIKAARRAVGDDGHRQAVIRTVHGRGYQFVATIEPAGVPLRRPAVEDGQRIRFFTAADGTRIAFAESGSGPPLVKAANWLTHLDLEWDSPVWGHWLAALSDGYRLIRYDERGCGLSDRDEVRITFDAWVADLADVVDAAVVDGPFTLLGISQGGAVAVAYAAQHPERVDALVLVGAYARGRMVRAATADEREDAALDINLAKVAWRRGEDAFFDVFASQFLPDATAKQRAAFNDLQRETTSATNAGRFLEEFAAIDIADVLPLVRCPTIVFHARDDHRVPVDQGIELAAAIPNSRLVLLDSRNHLLTVDEPAWPVFVAELRRFLAETAAR